MNDALVIMNARDIPPCMSAFRELPIDKIWLQGFTERGIADHWDQVLEHDYDWLWVVSDDVITRPPALAAVRELARKGHPVVTGYSQATHEDWRVNLTSEPIRGSVPDERSYTFRQYRDVVSWPTREIPTWFTGMSLTGMSAAMWSLYRFDCYSDPGFASDFNLSVRLQGDGVPIVAAREGFAYHWRHWGVYSQDSPDEKVSVGRNMIEHELWRPRRKVLA